MILTDASADDARGVGDRICGAVRTHGFGGGAGARTLSIGAAAAPDHGQSYEAVLEAKRPPRSPEFSRRGDGAAAMPPPHLMTH
jgi:GGDEF domain-containing protein